MSSDKRCAADLRQLKCDTWKGTNSRLSEPSERTDLRINVRLATNIGGVPNDAPMRVKRSGWPF
jgi:hypothetical protein